MRRRCASGTLGCPWAAGRPPAGAGWLRCWALQPLRAPGQSPAFSMGHLMFRACPEGCLCKPSHWWPAEPLTQGVAGCCGRADVSPGFGTCLASCVDLGSGSCHNVTTAVRMSIVLGEACPACARAVRACKYAALLWNWPRAGAPAAMLQNCRYEHLSEIGGNMDQQDSRQLY